MEKQISQWKRCCAWHWFGSLRCSIRKSWSFFCMCLRTMRLWSKWLWKAEVQQWDMFPELIEFLLIGCSIELILTQRSKLNTSTPRINLQTSWQRGISHAMNGITCWPCLILAILALLLASQRWRNELNKIQEKDVSQQKSRPMMNLTARTPSFVSSSASANPERTSYGYQDPEQLVLDDRAGQPVETSRSNYSQDYGLSWSSQVWKSGDGEHDRPGQPDKNSWKVDPHRGEHLLGRTAHSARNEETIPDRTGKPASENIQGKADFEKFIVGSETAEFVNKVRNQVRIRQKRMSSNAEDCTEHSIIWGMFMATTLNAATLKGKIFNHAECCAEWRKSYIEKDVWRHCTNDPQWRRNLLFGQSRGIRRILGHNCRWLMIQWSLVFKAQRSTYFQILCYVSAKFFNILNATKLGRPSCRSTSREELQRFGGRQWESLLEFEWNIFPGFTSLQLCDRISKLLSSLGQSPETFTGRILFMSMFNDISCDRHDNKVECLKIAEFVKTFAKRFGIGRWSFIGPGSEKKWYPSENSPQGAWDHVAEDMLLKFAESGHPIFRATTPLSRGKLKSKGKGKVSIHFSADQDTVDTIHRIILSVNQLSIYGAVAAICDGYEGHSTGEPVILEGQSIVLGETKAEVPAHDAEPRDAQIILQQYFQQVKSLSPEDRLSKFCEEAGFMSVVEVGQIFSWQEMLVNFSIR